MNQTEAAMKFGETLGYIIWPIAFVAIGYVVARRINKDRDFDNQVKWPIVVGSSLALLMVVSLCVPNPNQLGPTDGVYIETADGGAAEPLPGPYDISRDSLAAVKAFQKERVVKFLDSKSWPHPGPDKFESSVVPVDYAGNTVLKSRFRSLGHFDLLIHEGVAKGRAKTVVCVAKGRANIRFENSRCAQAVYDTFARSEPSPEKL
ncbi:hypothetical protein GCM10009115_09890 [Sphingopyxis soli]|uniref:DUF1499 domain-containing protein n=1 Tax=Sphingopyxis soli TaxID=592051 RepID=A0ABN1M042_9SPHN|nr:hypothetical protein [Sphingopyxis soli]